MKLINKEIGLSISIEQHLLEKIVDFGRDQFPNEFGGVLVGYYSDNKRNVHIIDNLLPTDSISTKTSFKRGVGGLKDALVEYYNQTPSLVYVGEWHTHPNAAPVPSWTDCNAMREIVDASNVFIDNPIMVVIGLTEKLAKIAFYVYIKNKFYKYEVI